MPNWVEEFESASYIAYTTVVEPAGAEPLDNDPVELQARRRRDGRRLERVRSGCSRIRGCGVRGLQQRAGGAPITVHRMRGTGSVWCMGAAAFAAATQARAAAAVRLQSGSAAQVPSWAARPVGPAGGRQGPPSTPCHRLRAHPRCPLHQCRQRAPPTRARRARPPAGRQAVDYDDKTSDVHDPHTGSRTYQTMRVAVGDTVLLYPDSERGGGWGQGRGLVAGGRAVERGLGAAPGPRPDDGTGRQVRGVLTAEAAGLAGALAGAAHRAPDRACIALQRRGGTAHIPTPPPLAR
jgi:hypothetical protein